MPSATEIVRATLTGSSVHDGWEAVFRTEANERACEMMFDRIAELVSPGKALDVGCGIGQHSIRLSRRGFDVTAGDFSPDRVEAARKNIARHGLSIPVRQEDVTNLSFPPATFDAVLCWGVLMHVPEVQKAIAELCRVVRAGGYIIVYENNARSVFSWFLDAGVTAKRLFGLSHVQRSERTSLGVESWVKPRDAGEYLIRRVFVGPFVREFEKHGATLQYRLPGQFSEAYRLSPKLAPAVHLFNSAWFRSGIPTLAMGNIFVFCR